MLQIWKDIMAAHQHALSICMEGHSVPKGYGSQSCDQRDKGVLRQEDVLLIFGKTPLHFNNDISQIRSENNESQQSLGNSDDESSSLESCSAEQSKCHKEDSIFIAFSHYSWSNLTQPATVQVRFALQVHQKDRLFSPTAYFFENTKWWLRSAVCQVLLFRWRKLP